MQIFRCLKLQVLDIGELLISEILSECLCNTYIMGMCCIGKGEGGGLIC